MQILLAERHGFCHGVTRAVNLARTAAAGEKNVYTVGPLIHNPQMLERLKDEGVRCVSSLDDVEAGTVIVRSHGEGPGFFRKLKERDLQAVDATCENVKRVQKAARSMVEQGLRLVVAGERQHPEVAAILEWSDPNGITLKTPEEAAMLPKGEKLGIVVQTTFSVEVLRDIIKKLDTSGLEYELADTVCPATRLRQEAARDLAEKVDVMIVIGGRNSANTKHLAELCQESICRVYAVETADEIRPEWFSAHDRVGITAGASTPDWIIEEVKQRMENMDEVMEAKNERLEQGTILAGKVVGINKDLVFVDVGQKAEGFITLAELAWPAPMDAHDAVAMGQLLNVLVLEAETEEGSVKLSKVQADRLLAWDKLEEALQEKHSFEAVVTSAVKGGLSISIFGIRGFIPASHVDIAFIEDLAPYAGKTLEVLPIEIDREKQKAIFSRRAILEKLRRESETTAIGNLAAGQVIRGEVKRLASFGAFVDVGGIEGLVHVSEMAWYRVKDPAELLKVGDAVEVQVLNVDSETRKVSLGMKQLLQDPWLSAVADFAEGTTVPGKVTRTSKFGAFIELTPGVEGLAHISELSDKRVATAEEVVHVGQKLPVKVLSIDPGSKRISLSVIKAKEDADRKDFEQYLEAPTSLSATIGDKLGHLFKNTKE